MGWETGIIMWKNSTTGIALAFLCLWVALVAYIHHQISFAIFDICLVDINLFYAYKNYRLEKNKEVKELRLEEENRG